MRLLFFFLLLVAVGATGPEDHAPSSNDGRASPSADPPPAQFSDDMATTCLIHPAAALPPRTGTERWWLQEALRELHGPQQSKTGLADEDASPMVLDPPIEASPQASIPGAQAHEWLRSHPQFDFRDPRPAAPATALPSPPQEGLPAPAANPVVTMLYAFRTVTNNQRELPADVLAQIRASLGATAPVNPTLALPTPPSATITSPLPTAPTTLAPSASQTTAALLAGVAGTTPTPNLATSLQRFQTFLWSPGPGESDVITVTAPDTRRTYQMNTSESF
uniref:Uncharacterized protein n=1 Tax=Chromera velia CCMP2878 TaxID=1169474 RepID=A0A0G4GL34_9ALVE|eukprot:Cvel_22396.t1-p1 / transcript=Cvel_22396.t1 / gene=Cvel_22396 / organism=Chromera_velia_CCMP2878 / gene_product=hypothetical protein / transcript_product=hypothetical protein / location=Cvel_scaffold2197:10307-13320(+) / protein_length=277 / sequence_SO=supercontig / SO=protein_coding / is_pseudo=false